MTIIELDDIPPVELEIMNETHRDEVALVNAIGDLVKSIQLDTTDNICDNQVIQQAVTKKLSQWLEHTRQHFSREEKMMEEHDFHAYSIHSWAHQDALVKLEGVIKEWRESHDLEALSNYLFSEWPAWFQQHVMTMDYMTALYLNMRMQ